MNECRCFGAIGVLSEPVCNLQVIVGKEHQSMSDNKDVNRIGDNKFRNHLLRNERREQGTVIRVDLRAVGHLILFLPRGREASLARPETVVSRYSVPGKPEW